MEKLYTAEVMIEGARAGFARSSDNKLNVNLSKPKSMGGEGGDGTNPEQLFAAAVGPCYLAALDGVAKSERVTLTNPKLKVKCSFLKGEGKDYKLALELELTEEKLDEKVLQQLAEKTENVCPFTKAVKGNIDVKITARNPQAIEA